VEARVPCVEYALAGEDGVMKDLNALVAPGYNGILTTAQGINYRGVITGRAFDPVTGERPAFQAVPIPYLYFVRIQNLLNPGYLVGIIWHDRNVIEDPCRCHP
jgi:hypothetical protein